MQIDVVGQIENRMNSEVLGVRTEKTQLGSPYISFIAYNTVSFGKKELQRENSAVYPAVCVTKLHIISSNYEYDLKLITLYQNNYYHLSVSAQHISAVIHLKMSIHQIKLFFHSEIPSTINTLQSFHPTKTTNSVVVKAYLTREHMNSSTPLA